MDRGHTCWNGSAPLPSTINRPQSGAHQTHVSSLLPLQNVLVLDDWMGRMHEVRPAAKPAAAAEQQAAANGARPAVLEQAAAAAKPEPEARVEAEAEQVPDDAAPATTQLPAEVVEQPAAEPGAAAAGPTAAESWRSVLAVANEPYVPPQVAEVAAPGEAAAAAAGAADEAPASVAADTVPYEPAAAVGESAAVASWRSVLEVANQPYVPPQPQAEPAAQPQAEEGPAFAAAVPPAVAPAAAAAEAANGSQPAAPKPVAAAMPASTAVPAAAARPSSQRSLLQALAPWLRLALAAAVVLSAVFAFLRSPWGVARWARWAWSAI